MAIHALTFVFGVWLFQQMRVMPSIWLALLFFPLIFLFLFRPSCRKWLVPLFLVGLGFFWATTFAYIRLNDALPSIWEQREIQVEGVVSNLPQQFENGMRFEFDVEKVLTDGAVVPHHISLAQYSVGLGQATHHLAPVHAGERWQLLVKLKRPHGLVNPSGFDFEAWALERNIRATGSVRASGLNRRVNALIWRPGYLVQHVRQNIQANMQKTLQGKPYSGVLQALVIGNEDAISPADWQVFLRTGTNHLMSISGLHITMLSSLVFAFALFFWRRSTLLTLKIPARKAAVLFGLLTAFLYALVAGFSVPTQRTFYMLCVFALALWSDRRLSIGTVLAYALLVVALLDPWAVLAPGFWLSFGAVAFLAFALGGRLGQVNWWLSAIRSQWVATLVLIPFLLMFFQQFSLVSPLANAFAIPVISLLVVPLAIFGGVFSIEPTLLLAHAVMAKTMQLLQLLSDFDWAVWQQAAPTFWAVLLALVGLIWVLMPKGLPMRYLGFVFCLPLATMKPALPEFSELRLSVLDVGQGLSVVIQTHRHALLYDTGTKTSSQTDSGTRIVVPYLRSIGVGHLDGLVVSHDDIDHSGGMDSVLRSVPTDWLLTSLARPVKNVKNIHCVAGQSWQWDGVSFEVLSPLQESYQSDSVKDNNRSCVLRVSTPKGSVLLVGDIEREVESALVKSASATLKSDVLIVPHHGSKTSSTLDFIDAVNPEIAVFTAGYRNRFGHPKVEIVERYVASGIKTYRSDLDGAVLVDIGKSEDLGVIAWRHQARHYWYD
jgi:competence protein ComEC